MDLILAQGAEHIEQSRLKTIVAKINEQRGLNLDALLNKVISASKKSDIAVAKLEGMFGADWFYGYLAGKYHINYKDYSVEEKYDGYSYLNVDGRFFSKGLSTAKATKGMPIEKTGHVTHIAEILKQASFMCGCDLHGELYVPGGISDDVTKIMGCTEDEAVRRQQIILRDKGKNSLLHYRLLDIRCVNGIKVINEPHYIRHAIMEYVYDRFIVPYDHDGYINLAEELQGDPNEEFKRIVLRGGEGIIIKREDALYIPDKKPTDNWIKGKKKITYDVIITGLNDNGTGKNASMFGSLVFGHVIDGKIVNCGSSSSGMSDSIRRYIYDNIDTLIAKKQVFEIEAIQESVKSFRNAVFMRLRDDKDWTECTPINIRTKIDLF